MTTPSEFRIHKCPMCGSLLEAPVNMTLDRETKTVFWRGKPLFKGNKGRLFIALHDQLGRAVSYDTIEDAVWGGGVRATTDSGGVRLSLRVILSEIRKTCVKQGLPFTVMFVYGQGYRMNQWEMKRNDHSTAERSKTFHSR